MSSNAKRLCMMVVLLTVFIASGSAMAEVKIGFLGGFSGPVNGMTPGIYKAAKLAVKHVNHQGGVLDGQDIIMPNADTSCSDSAVAVTAADHLVNSEKVVGIVGAVCSSATLSAVKEVTIPSGVLLLSPASTSPEITSLEDNDLVFRTTPSDLYQGDIMARLLISKGIKTVAVTYVSNDYGKGFADSFSSAFKAVGGKVNAIEPHEEGKADYSPIIKKLASSGVETLVVLAYADGSGQTIIRQASKKGYFNQFVGGDGMVYNSLISAVGSDKLRGMIATKPGVPDTTGARKFKKISWNANINPASPFAAQSYDAAFLLALAIEKHGSTDRNGLSKALRNVATPPGKVILPGEWKKAKKLLKAGKEINYEGATGSLDFNEAGDVSGVIIEMGVNVREGSFIEYGQIK